MELTPMMQQYLATKEQEPDALLFFRLGDFYEMFFEDAKTVSRELGLTLTSRSGDKENCPMCGVPYHAAEQYVGKLIAKGYKVAIAEQIGDPKAKGLTKREIIKVVTPGTVLSDNALVNANNNYIALLHEDAVSGDIVLAGADISTGECFYGLYQGANRLQMMLDELYRLMMPELVLVGAMSFMETLQEFVELRMPNCLFTRLPEVTDEMEDILVQHFDASQRPSQQLVKEGVATLLSYLHRTVKTDLSQIICHCLPVIYLFLRNRGQADDCVHRGADIVRHCRQKIGLGFVGSFRFPGHDPELFVDGIHIQEIHHQKEQQTERNGPDQDPVFRIGIQIAYRR